MVTILFYNTNISITAVGFAVLFVYKSPNLTLILLVVILEL